MPLTPDKELAFFELLHSHPSQKLLEPSSADGSTVMMYAAEYHAHLAGKMGSGTSFDALEELGRLLNEIQDHPSSDSQAGTDYKIFPEVSTLMTLLGEFQGLAASGSKAGTDDQICEMVMKLLHEIHDHVSSGSKADTGENYANAQDLMNLLGEIYGDAPSGAQEHTAPVVPESQEGHLRLLENPDIHDY